MALVSAAISNFAASIEGDVVTRDHTDYPAAIARWAKNAERRALLVVFVKTAEDVAKSIAFAKANKLPIAIRGGGHNAAGASSIEDGLVIDLSRHITGVTVDEGKRVVYVGGGCVWGQVDRETMKYGLATVAGTVSHTGVAGLTVGGGYGWLTGRHGLTIDNLTQATVVTADGRILTANDTENADLFWAIRGGGSNFGVVTEFVFRLHEQRRTVFAGKVGFAADKLKRLLEVTKEWSERMGEDEAIHMAFAKAPLGASVLLILFYNGSEEDGRANFKKFFDIGAVFDHAKEMPYETVNTQLDESAVHGRCYYLSGFTHTSGPDLATGIDLVNQIEIHEAGGVFSPLILFEFFSPKRSISIPTSATAFRRNASFNGVCNIRWSGELPEKTDEARTAGRAIVERILGSAPSQRVSYTNYEHDTETTMSSEKGQKGPSRLGGNRSSRTELAFASNYLRLQVVKAKYDPGNMFNRWYPITPAE